MSSDEKYYLNQLSSSIDIIEFKSELFLLICIIFISNLNTSLLIIICKHANVPFFLNEL